AARRSRSFPTDATWWPRRAPRRQGSAGVFRIPRGGFRRPGWRGRPGGPCRTRGGASRSASLAGERSRVAGDAPIDEPMVAYRILARLDSAEILLGLDRLLQIRPGEAVAPGRPEVDLHEGAQRLFRYLLGPAGHRRDLRHPVGVLRVGDVLRGLHETGDGAHVRVAPRLEVVPCRDEQVVVRVGIDVADRGDDGQLPLHLLF